MLFFIALNALLVGFVHNSFIPHGATEFVSSSSQKAESLQESSSNMMESYTNINGASGDLQKFESTTSQSAKSFEEASSNAMESFSGNGINGGLQEFESTTSQSAKSFEEASSNTFESFNTNGISSGGLQEFESTMSQSAKSFEEASSNAMESFSANDINGGLQEFESTTNHSARSFEEASSNTFESSNTNGVHGGLQEFESSMSETAQSFQAESSDTMESFNTNGISGDLQEYASNQFKSESSQASSSSNYEHSSGLKSSTFDRNHYLRAFEKSEFISEIERQCYLRWLETFSHSSLKYYNNILKYLSVQEALSNEILDFKTLQKEILSAYETFASNDIYKVEVDLSTKTAIFEKTKSQLKNALKGLSQKSALYELLHYSVNSDLITLPCTIGLFHSIIKNQEIYFNKTTSSTNAVRSVGTSTSATKSSSVNVSQYESILKSANIQTAEAKAYLSHLSKLASDKTFLFTDIMDFLNKNTQVLTNDMILDFASFNQELESIYKLLVREKFFVEKANWQAKKAILTKVKTKLSKALSYVSKDCVIYQALQYCLEQDVSSIPLLAGLTVHVFKQQSPYFSPTTKTVSSSSSCSNIT